MRDGEAGDRLDERGRSGDEEHQPDHEEYVVEAEQQVFDAEGQVAEHRAALAGLDREVRVLGPQYAGNRRVVLQVDVDEHVRQRPREAVDAHLVAYETLGAAVRAPLVDEGGALHVGHLLQFQGAVIGERGLQGQTPVAEQRLLPEDVERAGFGLGDAEVGRTHLVALRAGGKQDADEDEAVRDAPTPAAGQRHSAPARSVPFVGGAGISISTRYCAASVS